ncbi:putative hydrophobic protein (TIGR00271 family) [Kitasatospora sp. GP82]|nr:putative hydrophobic protein (TIGR00271 family) [Kitasatospora sp. GP82]
MDALVWEAVSEITHEESTLSVVYQAFMSVATMLAACGAVLDSAILIVGAMAIGPEFGSLAGLSVAVVQRRARPAVRSVMALMVGFAMAMVRTTGFSLLMSGLGLFRAALASGPTVGTGGGSMSEKIFV